MPRHIIIRISVILVFHGVMSSGEEMRVLIYDENIDNKIFTTKHNMYRMRRVQTCTEATERNPANHRAYG